MNPFRLLPEDHASIFGDTYHGVPSPTVPHVHPYPTRFHGPIWSYPTFDQPYQPNLLARGPSYMGFGSPDGLGGCACKGGMSGSPDGLGEPLLCASTGSTGFDMVLGAAVGAVVAKRDEDRIAWAIGGAIAGLVGGLFGVVAVGGTGIYMRAK